jgi:Flp pilus assembly protein TadG
MTGWCGRETGAQEKGQEGAAIVDFVLVGGLLTLLFVAVLQLAIVLHVRNTLIDCAGAGARYGALADRDPAAGVQRTRELVTADLSAQYAGDIVATREPFDGLDTIVVRVRAPMPLIGLLGAGRVLVAEGHAVAERR